MNLVKISSLFQFLPSFQAGNKFLFLFLPRFQFKRGEIWGFTASSYHHLKFYALFFILVNFFFLLLKFFFVRRRISSLFFGKVNFPPGGRFWPKYLPLRGVKISCPEVGLPQHKNFLTLVKIYFMNFKQKCSQIKVIILYMRVGLLIDTLPQQ